MAWLMFNIAEYEGDEVFSDDFSDEFDSDPPNIASPLQHTPPMDSPHSEFTQDFSDDFIGVQTIAPYGFMMPERPRSRLWSRVAFPLIPMGLLLWQDGRTKLVASFSDPDVLSCDMAILGGNKFYAKSDSWQAQVMIAAGYPMVEIEGEPT